MAVVAGDASALDVMRTQVLSAHASPGATVTLALADFDRDGLDDALIGFTSPDGMLLVASRRDAGTWEQRQLLIVARGEQEQVQSRVYEGDSGPRLFVMQPDVLREYGGWPLELIRETRAPMEGSQFEIADVDGDVDEEVVSLLNGQIVVFDAASGTQLAAFSSPWAVDFELGQFDADAALEILVAATPGVVLDGASGLREWSYPDGFGPSIVTGHFGAAPNSPRFFARPSNFTSGPIGFRVSPYSPVIELPWFGGGTIAKDMNADGFDELVTVQQEELIVASGIGEPIYSFPIRDPFVGEVRAGSIDSVSTPDFLYIVPNTGGIDGPRLWFQSGVVGSSDELALSLSRGPHRALAAGDIDADGDAEIVVGSEISPGKLYVFDAATGVLQHLIEPRENYHSDTMGYSEIKLAQIDSDDALELILFGAGAGGAVVVARDGSTMEPQFRLGPTFGFNGPFSGSFRIVFGDVLDIDGNGTSEVVTIARGSGGDRVICHPLVEGEVVPAVSHLGIQPRQWLPIQIDADPAVEMLMLTEGRLVAWDPVTRTEQWFIPVVANAFAVLQQETAMAELVLVGEDTISFFDLQSRQLTASQSLGFASNGVSAHPERSDWLILGHSNGLSLWDRSGEAEVTRTALLPSTAEGVVREWRPVKVGETFALVTVDQAGYSVVGPVFPVSIFSDGFD